MTFSKVPYTNFHELNLDWMLAEMTGIRKDIDLLNEWKATRDERDAEIDEQLADFEVRFTRLELLYNDFVSEVNARFDELSTQITDQVDALETRITEQVNRLQDDVYYQLDQTQRALAAEMAQFKADVQGVLAVYNVRIIDVENGLERIIDDLPNMFMIVDPYTGEENTIVNVIYEIVNQSKTMALTADEYDTKLLTATAYDALQLTAYNYDFNGKDLIP